MKLQVNDGDGWRDVEANKATQDSIDKLLMEGRVYELEKALRTILDHAVLVSDNLYAVTMEGQVFAKLNALSKKHHK